MSNITEAFALGVHLRFAILQDNVTGSRVDWEVKQGKYIVSTGIAKDWSHTSVRSEFKKEIDAWQAIVAFMPNAMELLGQYPALVQRAAALRGQMLLGMGEARLDAMQDSVNAEILGIFETAMSVLGAIRTTRAEPKVFRVSHTRSTSWLEVRSKVSLPYHPEPVQLNVRCLPSPFEEKTWSVKLRVPSTTDSLSIETQLRFEELVAQLGYRGITVKDVQTGTCLDL